MTCSRSYLRLAQESMMRKKRPTWDYWRRNPSLNPQIKLNLLNNSRLSFSRRMKLMDLFLISFWNVRTRSRLIWWPHRCSGISHLRIKTNGSHIFYPTSICLTNRDFLCFLAFNTTYEKKWIDFYNFYFSLNIQLLAVRN